MENAKLIDHAKSICLKENIPFNNFIPFTDGSNFVASIDDRNVIKIFPPYHRHQWESEYRSLDFLQNKLSIPIPEFLSKGEYGGSTYVIMSRVEGISLQNVWNAFGHEIKRSLLHNLGRLMKEVQAVDASQLTITPDWDMFIALQLSGFKERHQKRGMPEWFMNNVDEFVNENLYLLPPELNPVLLTGEYTPFNILVDMQGNITGMIDFGDAMTGYHEYDLLGPVMFLVSGDKELFKALLNGYGYTHNEINDQLQKRLMVLQVLHRYSDFNAQLRIANWKSRADNLKVLMELIFPINS